MADSSLLGGLLGGAPTQKSILGQKTAAQFDYDPKARYPDIDHEDDMPEDGPKGREFEPMYKKLETLKGKVKPGNVLKLNDKKGNDFYFQRDDDYEHGFSYFPKPPPETS